MKTVIPFLLAVVLLVISSQEGIAQQNNHKHISSFRYAFGQTCMLITNEYAKEPEVKYTPSYIQSPYPVRKIVLYGPTLKFSILHKAEIERKSRFIIDTAREKAKKNGPHKPWISFYTDFILDSSRTAEKQFLLSGLQVKIIKNGKSISDWKKTTGLPKEITDMNSGSVNSYTVFNDTLAENDEVTFLFKNQTDSSLIQFECKRARSSLKPYLYMFGRDSSKTPYSGYVEERMNQKIKSGDTDGEFYKYWPADPHILLKNTLFPKNTKLDLHFRKPDPAYSYASLQYILSTGPLKDSVWAPTDNILFIPELNPGTKYKLLVRYKEAPANIAVYTFYTAPEWYQALYYKFLFWGIAALLLAGLSAVLYRYRLKKEKKRNTFLQYGLKSIRSQLNPHFVFNAMSSIQGLINKNDIPGANHYLSQFSNLLRESLYNNEKELIPLETELRLLNTYLQLEQLRFRFQYSVQPSEKLNVDTIEVPALLLQPLVENAIKHGISTMGENGRITIYLSQQQNNLHITITDNGTGFDTNMTTNGLGLKLTKDRIRLLNQSLKHQSINMEISSNKSTETTVHLSFKNWL